MSTVSKLTIKACSDNKFSSFTGEFVTSINPENLILKSGVGYHTPQSMAGASLLRYCGTPPRLLSFSLLFDNTGIVPGSSSVAVVEQVNQLQALAYDVQKKHHAPNYIRVIWGQIDFKGRLVQLEVAYSMFQMDGTLVRAEAKIAVLEEVPLIGSGKSAAGKDAERAQASQAGVVGTSEASGSPSRDGKEETFAATPDGTDGPYSGAPKGAYEGGPDDVYAGASNQDAPGGRAGATSGSRSSGAAGGDGMGGAGAGHPTGESHSGNSAHAASGGKTGQGAGSHAGSGGGLGSTPGSKEGSSLGKAMGRESGGKSSLFGFGLVGGVNSLKDKAKGKIPKLSLWQQMKLVAKKVRSKVKKKMSPG